MLFLQEAALKDAISKFNNEVDGKLDRLEIDPLKDYISMDDFFNAHARGSAVNTPSQNLHVITFLYPWIAIEYNYIMFLYYIDKRIKANKCKHADLPGGDDFAAGMTK